MIKNDYLKQGEQTKITEKIDTIAAGFESSGFDLIFEILNWLHFAEHLGLAIASIEAVSR